MKVRVLMLAALFLSGFSALAYEIIYTKSLILIFGTSVYAYSTMLAAFMVGMGLGSWLIKRFIKKINPVSMFIYLEVGISLYAFVFIPLLNQLDVAYVLVYLSSSGFLILSAMLIALSASVLLIPALFMGMTFPLASTIVIEAGSLGRDIGKVFAVNTSGGLFGSFMAGFVLIPFLGPEKSIVLAAAINLLAAAIMLMAEGIPRKLPSFALSIGFIMLLAVLVSNQSIDPYRIGIYYRVNDYASFDDYAKNVENARSSMNITFSEYGLYGSVLVEETADTKVLLINGKPDASTSGDLATELVSGYIPMMLHKNPKDVAIIGLGSGITLAVVENFNISRVDMFEINPTVIKANQFFQKENRNALNDSRMNLIVADARNYLMTSKEKYDVIISEPSNPWVEGEGFLFTREFYQIIKNHLSSDGIFLQWIGAYDFDKEDLQTSLNTIGSVFPYYQLWGDEKWSDLYILASDRKPDMDYGRIRSLFGSALINSDFSDLGQAVGRSHLKDQDLLLSFYIADSNVLKDYASQGEINSDDRPIIEFHTAANRNRVIDDNMIPVLKYIGGNSSVTNLKPPLVNLIGSNGSLDFMGLETGNLEMSFSDSEYYYSYIRRDEGNTSFYVFQPRRLAVFTKGNLSLMIYDLPRPTMPSEEEYEYIADSIKTGIQSKISQDAGFRYKMVGTEAIGMAWYCESTKSLYIAYFMYPAGSAIDKSWMDSTLLGIKCKNWAIF
jgi:spermidine synthase